MNEALEDRCRRYVREVARFSRVMNLTAIQGETKFNSLFIEPSLALCAWMPASGRLLDVGSGMGVPGIPIMLAKPGLSGLLVERRRKRAEFLRHIVRLFQLDATVYDADLRDLEPLRADVCVARAVSQPGRLLEMCVLHMNRGGIALLPVSRYAESANAAGWSFNEEYTVQAGGGLQKVHKYHYEGVSRET